MADVYSNLDPRTRAAIEKAQQNNPIFQQAKALQQISKDMAAVLTTLQSQGTKSERTVGDVSELLFEIRDGIDALANVETPETPDYAKPVVAAVSELKTSLTAAIKAIKVDPQVTVTSPDVSVPEIDLTPIIDTLKTDIPAAFEQAIQSIPESPEPDLGPLTSKLDEMLAKLGEIDTGVRMKPINAGLTNAELRATAVMVTDQPLKIELDESNPAYFYLGTAAVGSSKASPVWRIRKIDQTTGLDDAWADGDSNFDNVWDNRAGLSYS